MIIVNNKYLSAKRQIQQNENDIEKLKKLLCRVYKCSIDLQENSDNVLIEYTNINLTSDIDNAFLLSKNGKLFKIIRLAMNTNNQMVIYIEFYANLPQGAKGEKGDTGERGLTGEPGQTGPQGERGLTGETGPQGPKGNNGAQGVGIAGIQLNNDYTLTILYTNGETSTTASIRGAQGPQGPKGDTGETGPAGPMPPISQTTGNATNEVMSQYAVTRELNNKAGLNISNSFTRPQNFESGTTFRDNIYLSKQDEVAVYMNNNQILRVNRTNSSIINARKHIYFRPVGSNTGVKIDGDNFNIAPEISSQLYDLGNQNIPFRNLYLNGVLYINSVDVMAKIQELENRIATLEG